jgi:hypothetical protein
MPMIFFTSVAGVILHLLNYLKKRNTPVLSYFLYCTVSGLMSPIIIQKVDLFGFQPIHILMLILHAIALVLLVLTAPESKKI